MKPIRILSAPCRRFSREDGSATIEFVILFPLIMYLFLSAFEVGLFLTRSAMLERAVDLNVRELRLGTLEPATHAQLKAQICEDALIFSDCPNSVLVELVPVSKDSWALPAGPFRCVDRTAEIQPAVDFNLGSENEIMLVRACAVLDPFFSSTSFVMQMPLDASGGYALASASTFVNEP